MATSFDATARIQLDIRSFAQGASAITKSGGQMEKVFQNLNTVLGKVALVESGLAAKLRTSLQVYNQISSATKNYATAVAALQKNEQQGANGARHMAAAFQQLRGALAQVQGLSEKEYQRLSKTVHLYERMANVVRMLASAQKQMSSVTQNAITAQQKDEQAKRKGEETARRLALEEQKLAARREQLAQSAARIAQEEQRLAQSRQRLSQATDSASRSQVSFSGSTFAVRSSLGELEGSFQQLLSTVIRVPQALAGAAISQEASFAQVVRVVGEAEAEAAGLLHRFQQIAQNAPISFEEVARIGQLGAQIGVSASNLGDFTDTIVKFSLTTGVASEEATLLLGRIAQMQDVPISEVEQLGSAILALGTASAATDQEILRVNASIATVSNLFGLTAQQTAGLSAALATLQVRPELSRGALTRVFYELSQAVGEGGESLEKLSSITGLSDKELLKLYNNPATRGDFLLAFIQGLHNVIESGGNVQIALRGLGVNAVRDIDVFSRLANNTDIVRESFDRANVEFARGTELNRQAKDIYETTSAELQNLSDAFKTLLATLGGPLATALGAVAKGLADIIEGLAHMGPIVPIFGTLAAVVATGGAAWLLYQVALSKTVQSLIAARELQQNLGVSSITLRTAIDVYRGSLSAATTSQTVMNLGMRELNVSSSTLAASLARSQVGIRAHAAAAASSAAGLNAMSASNVAASRSLQNVGLATGITVGSFRALNSAGVASALAMTNVSNANRNLALTQAQLANSSRVYASQTAISATAVQGLNTSAVRTVPLMTNMSTSMQRAATAGAQLGSGLGTTVNAGTTAATAFTRVGQATQSAGLAARAASFAFGPWGIALSTIGILMAPLLGDLFDFRSESEKIASAAMEATGGTQALANAIKADTEAAANGVKPFRELRVEKENISGTDRKAAESARSEAEERKRAIELTKGSVDELKQQAAGHGEGAEAARRYLREIAKANDTIRESTKALGDNTVAIGQNVQQWLLDTAQAVVEQSKLADGSERSAEALKQLSETGLDVGELLQKSLTDPQAAIKELDAALKGVNETSKKREAGPVYGKNQTMVLTEEAKAAERLKNFLEGLREVMSSESDEATKAALTKKLLKDALDDTGKAASSASGRIKLGKEALEDLDSSADDAQQAIDQLGQQFEKFGTPLDAFKTAAKNSFKDAEDAMNKFKLSSKGGLDEYIKQLDKIAKAQREWSANLIKISATLGPDIADQFRKLGPEAAPAVAQLAELSAKELAKLGPKLREIGSTATSDLAASIIQNSGKIKNATLQTRSILSNVFGKVIDKAKTSEDFSVISNEYSKLVQTLGKSKVKIDITADSAKAFKSLSDLQLYVDLVGRQKVEPKVALNLLEARNDLTSLQKMILDLKTSGRLDATGKAQLDTFFFKAQLTQLTTMVDGLEAEGKLDAKGKGKLSDSEYRAKVLALTEFLASQEGQGLLNPDGKAQLHDKAYRSQIEALANLILGKEAAGEFDVNGDGKLSTGEFKKLLDALKRAVADANKGKLNPKGHVTLAGTSNFSRQLGGIVQAAYRAGGSISRALSRSATVSVGYYYYQKNSPPKTAQAATGGWIHGPGGPKSDAIPAMLSNGEFVVQASAARRFGALLEVINRSGGRGFSGIVKRWMDSGVTGGGKQIQVRQGGGANTMLGKSMVQQVPPESASAFTARMAMPQSGPTNVFNINNQYPQAEPTSVTINRSLAYAATISGV
ncbi:phage tail tape measure protein [Streptomyces cucumeris]|uniref:phage tail tape measure protein n=1 Tax=Streptomyces cucumeris TaxID=2962890 RepID=UPI0020C871B5|nr:phage tail tape measure protein [Streptomyces sp. NEAU-Y11]MCP9209716.1 phage tail tape measure protein [Streptomyces sp. NEAU-Y11]